MTEFITKPSSKVKTVAKVTGGGLTVGTMVFMYATFASKTDVDKAEQRAAQARVEMQTFQRETWQKLMDVQSAVEANRATLDAYIRMRASRTATNGLAVIP